MTNHILISIPEPCHENWDTMVAADRGRFCMACQKQVIDFTKASDREIAEALKQDKNLCGKFRNTQLDRKLIIQKEKNKITAFWALAFSMITLSANAQEKKKTTQVTHIKASTKEHKKSGFHAVTITGTVVDSIHKPLKNVAVLVKGKAIEATTDNLGIFKIKANIGDILVFNIVGYSTEEIAIKDISPIAVTLQEDDGAIVTAYGSHRISVITGAVAIIETQTITQKRSFLGRIFHKIGNVFRKNE